MAMDTAELLKLVEKDLLGQWNAERQRLDHVDGWARWSHDEPHQPKQATQEYTELAARAQAPWGDLIVSAIAQTLYVEGYRRADDPENGRPWRIWQANGMDGRQVAVHRATLAYGRAFGTALPGKLLTGESMPTMRGWSPREMIAFYDDPAADEWPELAMRVRTIAGVQTITVLDDQLVHTFRSDEPHGKLEPVGDPEAHGAGVCPVVRFTNRFDLEGRAAGEIEPFIPVLGRIDQTTFDRLVVQRFASWVVRTIAGMAKPEDGSDAAAEKLRLMMEDLLVAEDPDTKFGSLPATPLEGFIQAHDADVRVLAAVSQTPAHEMLGQMANLSAEALAAARASQTAKSDERKHTFGETWEQWLRLAAHIEGDADSAGDFEAQVRWKDTEIRSMAQAADALGKLAQMLKVPVELLWEKIPGFTQQDVETAKVLIERGGALEELVRSLEEGQQTQQPEPAAA